MARLTKKKLLEQQGKEAGMPCQVFPPTVEEFLKEATRDEMIQALNASDDPVAKDVMKSMLMPKPWNFTAICRHHGLTYTSLVEIFSKYQLNNGIIRQMKHLPRVMEDVAVDAMSKAEPCPRCDGDGEVPDENAKSEDGEIKIRITKTCPLCKGRKEVRVPGDKLARELVYESAGLTGKKGPSVAIQQNFGAGGDHSIESSVGLTQKLLK